MGCLCSKHSDHKSKSATYYQDARQSDPKLQSFDLTQQVRITQVIDSFAADAKALSLSVKSFSQAIGNLQDMNDDVVKYILESESDIKKNRDISLLVKDFLRLSDLTIDFCSSLENCLENAASSTSILKTTIDEFDKDNDHLKTLERFKEFTAVEAPFTQEFLDKSKNVLKQQQSMQKKLEKQMGKVAKKLKSTKVWMFLTNMIFVVTLSTLAICSVVVALVGGPPVVGPLLALASRTTEYAWNKADLSWKKYEEELKARMELMGKMPNYNDIVIEELKNINALVDNFRNKKKDLVGKAESAIKENEKVAVAKTVEEIRKIINGFEKTINDLTDGTKKIRENLDKAQNMIVDSLSKNSTC